ncbi:MAG: leucine-rich repeat domain-containing protein [Bdellovibrionales bacterium]|nr:leucine-rich repeat domain-containing protein [Bdellovibrionales bacterium]
MIKLISILFILSISSVAFSQESFLKVCKFPFTQKKSIQNDIKWFKSLYETNDCKKIALELSKLKSLSEIIMPFGTNVATDNSDSWTNAFPHLYGMKKHLNDFQFFTAANQIKRHQIFVDIEIYKDFTNITDMPIVQGYAYSDNFLDNPGIRPVCELPKLFPNLKTITLTIRDLEEYDECLSSYDIIIRGGFNKLPAKKLKSKIIGVEKFEGQIESLGALKGLKYLGFSDHARIEVAPAEVMNQSLAVFSRMSGITHLSLNASKIIGIYNIKFLKNLNWLSITCIEDEERLSNNPCAEYAYVNNNIEFLNELTWLRYLNLNYTGIKFLDRVFGWKRLETLKLRGNSIFYVPDFKTLPALKYLDISGNSIGTLGNIVESQELKFINLSKNLIKDLSPLALLPNLKYLNISNNPFKFRTLSANPPPQLKALGVNGACFSKIVNDLGINLTNLSISKSEEEFQLMSEAVDGDFRVARDEIEPYVLSPEYWDQIKLDRCSGVTTFEETEDFSRFHKLEVLSMRSNQLKHLPELNTLTELKYLDIEGNDLTGLTPSLVLPQLKVLGMSFNQVELLPGFLGLPKINVINLNGNTIKDISKAKIISEYDILMGLQGNRIEDVRPVFDKKHKKIFFDLLGNPIKKEFCPIVKEDNPYFDLCDFVHFGERGEDDIG